MRRIAIAVAVAVAIAAANTAAAQPYRVVDLGVLPGQASSVPSDINNHLQVVGMSGDRAFQWDPVNGMRALPLTSPPQINNSGIVVGLRSSGGGRDVLALFQGAEFVIASPPDTIASVSELTDNNILLLQGTQSWGIVGSTILNLSAIFGGGAFDINEQAMVGGSTGPTPYVRLSDGRVVQPWDDPEPVRLVGSGGHFAGVGHFGLPDGTVVPMPPFVMPFTSVPVPYGINRSGDVIGTRVRFFEFSPYLFRGGRLIELSAMTTGCDCGLVSARAINDDGYIAGIAQFPSGPPQRAVLLVPIAPATPVGFAASVNGRTVTLSWQASIGAVDYVLEVGSATGLSDLFNGSIGDSTTLTVTVPAGRYYVRLRARNAVGVSAPTAELIIDIA